MTKGGATLPWGGVAKQKVFFLTLGGRTGPHVHGMTKGRAALSSGAVAKQKVFFITLGGRTGPHVHGMTKGRAALSSGFGVAEDQPQIPFDFAPSKNIPKKGPRNCRSLGCARDDKGEGDASMESGCWTEGVFHLLRWAASGLRPITT